jgi:hypothetical protein
VNHQAWSFFSNKVSLCIPGWPKTHDPHASASWVLRLQVCTTITGTCLILENWEFIALSLFKHFIIGINDYWN